MYKFHLNFLSFVAYNDVVVKEIVLIRFSN